jgi:hypothetical protein
MKSKQIVCWFSLIGLVALMSSTRLNEIRRITWEANHPAATVLELYEMNHLFQTVALQPGEYFAKREDFFTEAVEIMTAWLRITAPRSSRKLGLGSGRPC